MHHALLTIKMRTAFFILLLAVFCPCLEAGVTVESITDFRTTETPGNQLKINLNIQDPLLSTALDYHQLVISRAEDDQGTNLIPPDEEGKEKKDDFQTLQTRPSEPHPSTQMTFSLLSPPRQASTLKHLQGSVTVRTFRTQKIVIEKAFDTFGRMIDDPLLKAHGIDVQVINPRHAHPGVTEEEEIKRLMKTNLCVEVTGAANKIRGMELIDPQFNIIPSRSRTYGSSRRAIWICAADEPLPNDAAIRLSIPIDPTGHKIEFNLKDIPLP